MESTPTNSITRSILNIELTAADALRVTVIVRDNPRDRVQAIRELGGVEHVIADRPAGILQPRKEGCDVGAEVVISRMPHRLVVDVDGDG